MNYVPLHRSYPLLLFISLLLLNGCTHIQPASHEVPIAQGVSMPLVLPTQHGSASQMVTGTYRKEAHTLLMQIESSDKQFVMAGLTPTGTRLFTASYDGEAIRSWQSPLFTAPFDGSFLIADFLLTTLDAHTLAGLLHLGSIREHEVDQAIEREILNGLQNPVIRIRYSNALQRNAGAVDYCHLERLYCLHIETLEIENSP